MEGQASNKVDTFEQVKKYIPDRLVDDIQPIIQPFPLAENYVYSKLGRALVLEARPCVVHFAGYHMNKVYQKTLRIVNVSDVSQRIHILLPEVLEFDLHYDKIGWIAPGMSQQIRVHFKPGEWKYYYDQIRIHCSAMGTSNNKDTTFGASQDNLRVPIHAYPIVNEDVFPRRIDMGNVPLGESKTQAIEIRGETPIEFEYELTIVTKHPDFQVTPLRGVIPALNSTIVYITYTPSQRRTATFQIQVNISQFATQPFMCTVVASSSTSDRHDDLIDLKERVSDDKQKEKLLVRREMFKKSEDNLKQVKRKSKFESNGTNKQDAKHMNRLGGVRMPYRIGTSHSAVNYVLLQRPGNQENSAYSTLADIHDAICERRKHEKQNITVGENSIVQPVEERIDDKVVESNAEKASKQLAMFRLNFEHRNDADMDISFPGDTPMNRLTNAERLYSQAKEFDRLVAIKPSWNRIGQQTMTKEQLENAREEMNRQLRHQARLQRQMDRNRVETVMSNEPARIPLGQTFDLEPQFDKLKNKTWKLREDAMKLFLQLVNKILTRIRVDKRIAQITNAFVRSGKLNIHTLPEQLRAQLSASGELVDPFQHPSSEEVHKLKLPECYAFTSDNVAPLTFPQVDELRIDFKTVQIHPLPSFIQVAKFQLLTPQTYRMRGYSETLMGEPFPAYVPPERHRKPLSGAQEEYALRPACFTKRGSTDATMPSSLGRARRIGANYELLTSQPGEVQQHTLQLQSEASIEYALRPSVARNPVNLTRSFLDEPLASRSICNLENLLHMKTDWLSSMDDNRGDGDDVMAHGSYALRVGKRLDHQLEEDDLSDDSDADPDDEGDLINSKPPTWVDAQRLFEDDNDNLKNDAATWISTLVQTMTPREKAEAEHDIAMCSARKEASQLLTRRLEKLATIDGLPKDLIVSTFTIDD